MTQIWAVCGRWLTTVPIMFVFYCCLQAVYICVRKAEAVEVLTYPSHVTVTTGNLLLRVMHSHLSAAEYQDYNQINVGTIGDIANLLFGRRATSCKHNADVVPHLVVNSSGSKNFHTSSRRRATLSIIWSSGQRLALVWCPTTPEGNIWLC